jgi:hypothetical protein
MITTAQSTREMMRDQTAYVALAACLLEGCRVEFQDRAQNEFVKLWAIPGPETTRLADDGELHEEITEKVFDIPRQLGCSCGNEDCPRAGIYDSHEEVVLFPPEGGVSVNAQVRFECRDYSVKVPKCDSLRANYTLECEWNKPRGTSKI